MSTPWRFLAGFMVAAVVIAFGVAWVRAMARSRRLQRAYRSASPAERAVLDARALVEPELAAYMIPLKPWQVVLSFLMVGALVVLKFTGAI